MVGGRQCTGKLQGTGQHQWGNSSIIIINEFNPGSQGQGKGLPVLMEIYLIRLINIGHRATSLGHKISH
jgi:hypothetical protein